jgi:hypothetical protein
MKSHLATLQLSSTLGGLGVWLLCATQSAIALDPSRLWLPQAQDSLQADLVRAAQVAEDLERCTTVLEGTLDIEQSTPRQPIYRILCRQSDGRSYNEMVDGSTFETLTTIVVKEKALTKEELTLKSAQAQAELVKRTTDAWNRCDEKIKFATRMMIDMVLLTEGRPESTTAGPDEQVFVVAFDAKGIRGEALHFNAICTGSLNSPDAKVVIKRRDANK